VQPIRTNVRTNHRPTLIQKGGHRSTTIKETTAPIKTKQNKTKQNKTKQNKTKQNKTKQNKTSHMTYQQNNTVRTSKQQPKRPKFENIDGQEY
jgi:hypothetical protein